MFDFEEKMREISESCVVFFLLVLVRFVQIRFCREREREIERSREISPERERESSLPWSEGREGSIGGEVRG